MNRLLTTCVAGVLVVSGLAGCQSGPSATADAVFAVEGRVNTVRSGDAVSIRLPSNPSTGFAWVLQPYDETVLTPSTPFNAVEPGARAGGEVGVPGETVWRFEAASAGQTTLTFEYRQAWSGASPARTAAFRVAVR